MLQKCKLFNIVNKGGKYILIVYWYVITCVPSKSKNREEELVSNSSLTLTFRKSYFCFLCNLCII